MRKISLFLMLFLSIATASYAGTATYKVVSLDNETIERIEIKQETTRFSIKKLQEQLMQINKILENLEQKKATIAAELKSAQAIIQQHKLNE